MTVSAINPQPPTANRAIHNPSGKLSPVAGTPAGAEEGAAVGAGVGAGVGSFSV